MGRRAGSKNKATLAREAAQLALTAQEHSSAEADALLADMRPAESAPASAFIEYLAPDGRRWRVERGGDLLEDFAAEHEEMTALHEAVAADERSWMAARYFYGIAPLLGEKNGDFMRPAGLTEAEVGERLAISAEGVRAILKGVVTHWQRWRMSRRSAEVAAPRDTAAGAQDEEKVGLPTEQADKLLRLHGFDAVDEADRDYVAKRILDLQTKLEDEEGCSIARNAISLELQMINYDRMLQDVQSALRTERDHDKKRAARREIQELTKTRGDLSTQHIAVMKSLDATQAQNPTARKRAVFRDCVSTLTEAIRAYYARGDRALVDGVFTAAEIQILIQDVTFREPQYRLDIVGVINHSMTEINFFNPDYEPPTLERTTYRRFQRALRDSLRASQEGGAVALEEEDEIGIAGASSELSEPAGEAADTPGMIIPAEIGGRGRREEPLRAGEDFV